MVDLCHCLHQLFMLELAIPTEYWLGFELPYPAFLHALEE